ncbi:MAG: lipoyl(octanoyl) transferase LipB [Gammaproteobacteria bacterium]
MDIPLIVRRLGVQEYASSWRKMQAFNQSRTEITPDEIWFLQHPSVFTLGQAGKPEHVLRPGEIPLVESDRGGQVTYHGPGQLVAYTLLDLKRRKLGVRATVTRLEASIIALLDELNIESQARPDAPGVYVQQAKIAALGLRVKQGRCYHGLSFNVNVDLEPFSRINPCGYEGLEVTSLSKLGHHYALPDIENRLLSHLCQQFEIKQVSNIND